MSIVRKLLGIFLKEKGINMHAMLMKFLIVQFAVNFVNTRIIQE